MKKILQIFIFTTIIICVTVFVAGNALADPATPGSKKDDKKSSFAGEVGKQFNAVSGGAGFTGTPEDPRLIVAKTIRTSLSLLGMVFVIIIIYAGYLWMTAGGNDEQVGSAKKWMTRSVIGLVVILTAYSITHFAIKIALNINDDPDATGLRKTSEYKYP